MATCLRSASVHREQLLRPGQPPGHLQRLHLQRLHLRRQVPHRQRGEQLAELRPAGVHPRRAVHQLDQPAEHLGGGAARVHPGEPGGDHLLHPVHMRGHLACGRVRVAGPPVHQLGGQHHPLVVLDPRVLDPHRRPEQHIGELSLVHRHRLPRVGQRRLRRSGQQAGGHRERDGAPGSPLS
ncbi:hypothetical protein [Crossiella cryophila]|uniref:Uncharacterized protein n=1 Tax=Crossiella cryophila TaxID=43355 RepID=A0A7W7FQG3_9PSEU|nr:hypothetical protein [Crossiella cryophila]MBB4674916.1 hypothetical protein [Crossiella cryophila]